MKAVVEILRLEAVVELLKLNISQSLAEQLVFAAEQGNFIQFQSLLEQAVAADSTALGVGRSISDILAAVDTITKNIGTGITDSAVARELISTGLGKSASDTAATSDAIAVYPNKSPTDTAHMTDEEQLSIVKALFSELYATDDLDGAASLLDDQEMQFVKASSDAAYVADTLFRFVIFTRQFAENSFASDEQALLLGKNVNDDLDVSEVFSFVLAYVRALEDNGYAQDAITARTFDKALAHTGVASDDFFRAVAYVREFYNSAAAADTFSSTVSKPLSDALSVSDAIEVLLIVNILLAETVSFSDTHQSAYTKSLADILSVTDDIDGEASVLDDQEMQFVKQQTDSAIMSDVIEFIISVVRSFQETPSVADALAKATARSQSDNALAGDTAIVAPGKGLQNTASTSDAGSLRSQGYCDLSYFAGDYVGATRTF